MLVDIQQQRQYPAELLISGGKIRSILPVTPPAGQPLHYLLPGFIDSHVHIESSMLIPSEFARLAVVHGTVSTVSDPHEIANVCGMEGVDFMINNGKTVPFKFNFGAPSCVPATVFETAGATLDAEQVEELLNRPEIKYLSEMMNFPGVLNGDEQVMKKIAASLRLGKPVDGHAPGLRGEMAERYIKAAPPPPEGGLSESSKAVKSLQVSEAKASPLEGFGEASISTDHECFTAEEALDKLRFGMKIIIREGSAAKNFDALIDLLNDWEDRVMFCSDDKHPDSLVLGHINQLCARAVARGIDIYKVLKAACVNPVLHYKLDVGLLREGDPADFIVVKDLKGFGVMRTYIDGELVAESQKSKVKSQKTGTVNHFSCSPKEVKDFEIKGISRHEKTASAWLTEDEATNPTIPVIEALDGQLITNRLELMPTIRDGKLISDAEKDILKIVVVNRYSDAPVAKAFIKGFGLKQGALASSVAHDSHNIVAVGVDDESLCRAVNLVIQERGGISAVSSEKEKVLGLPVAGLMSNGDGYEIAAAYTEIDKMTKEDLGSTLGSPFMTLSFMALLVIPHLKLSDKGLFDGDGFRFVE
ncbi:MAG: adenine deaminase [Sphingobacteriales bacterium]|nr:adenine deaminase [Sphingobacteriales bacterium]